MQDIFQHPSITDWLQAIGSIGTLLVAMLAFYRWRQPDDARRQADFAQKLLREVQEVEELLFRRRQLFIMQEGSRSEMVDKYGAFFDDFEGFDTEIKAARDNLQRQLEEARILCGDAAASMMDRLAKRCRERLSANFTMRNLESFVEKPEKDPYPPHIPPWPMEELVESGNVLGAIVLKQGQRGREFEKDRWADTVKAEGRELRQALAKLIVNASARHR